MPTYEYECLACHTRFEVFQKISDDPIKECTACKGEVRRLISTGAGFIFKGSGFYTTDYRSDSYKKGANEDSQKSASPEACKACPQSGACQEKKQSI